ncbi:protein of unknown function [Paraburkholderia kururiensis]
MHDESTLGIGQRVSYETPGLTAPNIRTSVQERADGAACSRVHCVGVLPRVWVTTALRVQICGDSCSRPGPARRGEPRRRPSACPAL